MMVKLGWINWARLIIWLIIGLFVYFFYGQKHSRVQQGELPGELDPGADSPSSPGPV
jgi:APA family basic amino acid/polyamine antiporter